MIDISKLVTTEDKAAHLAAQLLADQHTKAKAALAANDNVAIRCAKAGVPYPVEWLDYDAALRAIVVSSTHDAGLVWPVKPAYPAGT